MRVLIVVVDDEVDMATLFRQQFRRDLKAGRFEMEFATSAAEALGIIVNAGGQEIILLLSDINMPGMSGFELLPRVKALRPGLPVIIMSAYCDAETRQRALEHGAEGLVHKPIDFAALRDEVECRLVGNGAAP